MPHTAIASVTADKAPDLYNYSTVTLIAQGVMPSGKNIYIFLGTAHSLNRDRKIHTPHGPMEVDEIFEVRYMLYDDLGRGVNMASIKETDPDATFYVDGDSESDIALLTIIMTQQLHVTPAKLIRESVADRLELGQSVYIGSAPCFPLVTFRTGAISLVPNDKIFMIDSGIAPGASGGGVYNGRGEYVGMITAMVCSDFIGVAVPMTVIYDFLRTKNLNFSTMCGGDDVGKDSIRGKQGAGGTSGQAAYGKKLGCDRGGAGDSNGKAAKEEEKEEEEGDREDPGEKEEGS